MALNDFVLRIKPGAGQTLPRNEVAPATMMTGTSAVTLVQDAGGDYAWQFAASGGALLFPSPFVSLPGGVTFTVQFEVTSQINGGYTALFGVGDGAGVAENNLTAIKYGSDSFVGAIYRQSGNGSGAAPAPAGKYTVVVREQAGATTAVWVTTPGRVGTAPNTVSAVETHVAFSFDRFFVALNASFEGTIRLYSAVVHADAKTDAECASLADAASAAALDALLSPPAGQAPQITAQPQPATVTAGQTANFSIGATGSGLTYQWRRRPAGGTVFAPIAGANAATLAVTSTTVGMSGDAFDCSVGGDTGPQPVVSTAVTLTVNAAAVAPQITAQPQSVSIAVGQVANFTVAATGTAPLGFQWRVNGAPVAGANASTYARTVLAGDNGAQVTVVVSNAVGSVTSAAATLTVPAAQSYSFTYALGLPVDNSGSQLFVNAPWVGYVIPFSAAAPAAAATAARTSISGTTAANGSVSIAGIPFAGGFMARLFFGSGASLAYYTIEGVAA